MIELPHEHNINKTKNKLMTETLKLLGEHRKAFRASNFKDEIFRDLEVEEQTSDLRKRLSVLHKYKDSVELRTLNKRIDELQFLLNNEFLMQDKNNMLFTNMLFRNIFITISKLTRVDGDTINVKQSLRNINSYLLGLTQSLIILKNHLSIAFGLWPLMIETIYQHSFTNVYDISQNFSRNSLWFAIMLNKIINKIKMESKQKNLDIKFVNLIYLLTSNIDSSQRVSFTRHVLLEGYQLKNIDEILSMIDRIYYNLEDITLSEIR